jgi:hypothetical protein
LITSVYDEVQYEAQIGIPLLTILHTTTAIVPLFNESVEIEGQANRTSMMASQIPFRFVLLLRLAALMFWRCLPIRPILYYRDFPGINGCGSLIPLVNGRRY